jgi:carbonic anhydrase
MKNTRSQILIASALECVLVVVTAHAQTVATPTANKPSGTITPTVTTSSAARPAHWGYEGQHGPTKWGALDPAYAACDKGQAQSPIDISKTGASTANPWKLNYRPTSLNVAHHDYDVDIVDNGHTIQVTVEEGSTITTSRNTYQLKQFHFHTPSEHTVDEKSFPMEVHFVHQSADKNFAVVSALFSEGPANENLAKLIANFPKAKGESLRLPEVKLDLVLQLPANTAAYTYMGSFTTPPCTENVEWLVFRDPVMASREQLDAFAARLKPNNRPVQPLNGRSIATGSTAGVRR